ncbi:MAG: ornithine cyclodeaminase family protein [Ardenticatenaceae bacterium]|nr:ornithine cyclodeaminase family protein [Ardenticatenaceae bacterium]
MLVLSAQDVREALPMAEAIAAMKRAYAALAAGRAEMPLRAQLPVAPHEAVSLFMPAFVQDEAGDALAVKVVSVFPHNVDKGLPLIHAAVLVLEAETGRPLTLLEGGTLTAIRTGAGAGAATDLLARPNSHVAAIFGAGVQARTQLEAVCTVRPIEKVWVYDPNPERAAAFAAEMPGQGMITQDVQTAVSPQQAVAQADIICAATTSLTPVFADADLLPGVHINAVGSYLPQMQEIPAATVARALVVVDSREASLAETGDLIQPINAGLFTADHIHAELGELLLGVRPGRADAAQITYFKSVGVAVQDAMAAQLALTRARHLGLGQQVNW